MSNVKCINCSHVIKENRIHEGVLVNEIICDNPNSEYYGKKFITRETFPVDQGCNKGVFIQTNDNESVKNKAIHSPGSLVVSNARDRFVNLLNSSNNSDTFESIITEYIHKFGDTIHADECCQVINLLSNIQYAKIANLNNIKRVAKEHATYLKLFLDGKMYTDNDDLNKYRDIQKQNAQAIIDICNNK